MLAFLRLRPVSQRLSILRPKTVRWAPAAASPASSSVTSDLRESSSTCDSPVAVVRPPTPDDHGFIGAGSGSHVPCPAIGFPMSDAFGVSLTWLPMTGSRFIHKSGGGSDQGLPISPHLDEGFRLMASTVRGLLVRRSRVRIPRLPAAPGAQHGPPHCTPRARPGHGARGRGDPGPRRGGREARTRPPVSARRLPAPRGSGRWRRRDGRSARVVQAPRRSSRLMRPVRTRAAASTSESMGSAWRKGLGGRGKSSPMCMIGRRAAKVSPNASRSIPC